MKIEYYFNDKSDLYASSRPRYPDKLFSFIFSYCNNFEQAWDCGTGNGQAAIGLSKKFKLVKATDISEEQIKNSLNRDNVDYAVTKAEDTKFADDSFDLVCVAQALHWFDYSKFWNEVKRVSKNNAFFAAWGYDWFTIEASIDSLIVKEIKEVVKPYWASNNRILWEGYKDVDFPFERTECPYFEIAASWSLNELFNYIHTWSAVRRCMEENGDSFFYDAYQKCVGLWGDPNIKKDIRMPVKSIMGRITK